MITVRCTAPEGNANWYYAVEFNYGRDMYNRPTATYCELMPLSDDAEGAVGGAHCHPSDQFSKPVGRKLAFTNALVHGGFSKQQRRELWDGLYGQVRVVA